MKSRIYYRMPYIKRKFDPYYIPNFMRLSPRMVRTRIFHGIKTKGRKKRSSRWKLVIKKRKKKIKKFKKHAILRKKVKPAFRKQILKLRQKTIENPVSYTLPTRVIKRTRGARRKWARANGYIFYPRFSMRVKRLLREHMRNYLEKKGKILGYFLIGDNTKTTFVKYKKDMTDDQILETDLGNVHLYPLFYKKYLKLIDQLWTRPFGIEF